MHNRANRLRAFTLIELMVVMVIIALLVVFLAVGFSSISQRARIRDTQSLILRVMEACDRFENAYGFYPPDNRERELPETAFDPAGDPANEINVLEAMGAEDWNDFSDDDDLESIQCLMFSLLLPRNGGPFITVDQDRLTNRDDGEVSLYLDEDGDFTFDGGGGTSEPQRTFELVDPWGTPFRFRSPTGREDDSGGYDDGDDDDLQDLQSPTSVEVYSAGPDRVFGEDDGDDNDGDGDTDEPGELAEDDLASWQTAGE